MQDRTYRPLGSDRFVRADVNVLAATNRDLAAMVRENQFRFDLFFPLNVLRLSVIPLPERRSDIALLARHFTNAFHKQSMNCSARHQTKKIFPNFVYRDLREVLASNRFGGLYDHDGREANPRCGR